MMAPSIRHDATSFSEDKALMTGLASKARGPVDQLEDRYLGMVEAVGSNPPRSTFRGKVGSRRSRQAAERGVPDDHARRGEEWRGGRHKYSRPGLSSHGGI